MVDNHNEIIHEMKKTIDYQESVLKKREGLLTAIVSNVQYL